MKHNRLRVVANDDRPARFRWPRWRPGRKLVGISIMATAFAALCWQVSTMSQQERGYWVVGLAFVALFVVAGLLRTAIPAATVVHIHKWEGRDDAS